MSETDPTRTETTKWDSIRKPYRELTRDCDICGYSLIGLKVGDQCPECGSPIDSWHPAYARSKLQAWIGWMTIVTYTSIVAGCVTLGLGFGIALLSMITADVLMFQFYRRNRSQRYALDTLFATRILFWALVPARVLIYTGFGIFLYTWIFWSP